jgi:poly-gamma-glutamate synthesis protein (capsule biosynthesis protein)
MVRRIILLCCGILLLLSPSFADDRDVTFCAVGDILLGRGIERVIDRNGMNYPFQRTAAFINSCDVAFGNLESPLSNRGTEASKVYTFRGDPAYASGLKEAGFDIVSLANNHMLDYGPEALLDTIESLDRNGLSHVGAGINQAEASHARIMRKNGLTIALLAYLDMPLEGIKYTDDMPGPALAEMDRVKGEISELRRKVDFIVVSFHWGVEFSPTSTVEQKNYARMAIDNGADLVIGHHPHVIQGIENYKDKLIIYSLGNFVFDQQKLEGRESMIFGCALSGDKVVSPYVIPILITEGQPDFARGEDHRRIAERIKSISVDGNINFTEENNTLHIMKKEFTILQRKSTPVKDFNIEDK